MSSYSASNTRKWNKVSFLLIATIVVLLVLVLFTGCDMPGVNNNGNNNGVNNNNGSPNNSCNGVDNCNNYGGYNPGSTQPPVSNQSSTSGNINPTAQGDFLYSPGPVTGPAIVEFWNRLGGADDICGTFMLPSGQTFNYKAGHWWQYDSDQDMQAAWPLHVSLFKQKPENAGCSVGQWPPS